LNSIPACEHAAEIAAAISRWSRQNAAGRSTLHSKRKARSDALAILTNIKMSKSEADLDALSLKLFVMGRTYDASDPHRAAIGAEFREVSRFLAKDSG
jgi:hypothetical protein